MRARDTSARTAVGMALQPHFPKGGRWQLVEHEGFVDDNERVRVRVAVRDIEHSRTGHSGMHLVTTHITVTVPSEALPAAEAQLDDEMDLFLFALDAADIPWEKASKGRFEDEGNRLGYQLDIETMTQPTERNK